MNEPGVCKHGYQSCKTCAAEAERIDALCRFIRSCFPEAPADLPKGYHVRVHVLPANLFEQREDGAPKIHMKLYVQGYHASQDVDSDVHLGASAYASLWGQIIRRITAQVASDWSNLNAMLRTIDLGVRRRPS